MTHTVVTSMSPAIFDGYGRDFFDTFARHWPLNVRCVVYLDGLDKAIGIPGLERFDLRPASEVRMLDEWMRRVKAFPLMQGQIDTKGGYDIQFDARQARKVFIEAHAVETFGGKVVWLDADVITHRDVPADLLDRCLPDDKLCAYLGRSGDFPAYSETGFIEWNADHPFAKTFMEAYRNFYLMGAIFLMKGWHDCIGFDYLRQQQPAKWFVNLADGLPAECKHVFINSALGAWLDHRKGNRKKSRSTKSDLMIERTEPYWQFDLDARPAD